MTPREGWTSDWSPAIEVLCALVVARYPDADLGWLRQRLAPLLTKTVNLVGLRQVENKKSAGFIRDAIVALRDMPPGQAVASLRRPETVLRDYLDGRSEAEDAEVDRPSDPSLDSDERAARRHAFATDPDNDLLPQPRRGTENPWAIVAEYVAELLADVTSREPKRTWDDYAQTDGGWPLEFFRRFAALAVAPAEPPRLDRVWRNALDARKRK